MYSLNPEYNPFKNKNKNAPYNQEQLDFIKQKLDEGWSPSRLHSEYGLATNSIKKRIKNNDWVVSSSKRENHLSNDELIQMKDMIESGKSDIEIADYFNISEASVARRRINGVKIRHGRCNTYTFNENYFDVIDNEHKAYWIGFLMADGYILSKRHRGIKHESQSFGFCISTADYEIFDNFKRDLNATNPVNVYNHNVTFSTDKEYNCHPTGRILLTSQHTVDMLKTHGVVENKTFITKMPEISEELIPAFIRGYSDGDGSISIDKNNRVNWGFCGTKELLNQIQEYFFGYDYYKLGQRFPERHNNNWQLKIAGWTNVPRCLDIAYKDATIYLKRKYDKYVEIRGKKERGDCATVTHHQHS